VTGEGIPDLIGTILKYTTTNLKEKITFQEKFDCTVLEVKKIEGHGTTIDVILVNGHLKEGDTIILTGFEGPIVTHIRALLTPHPMKEMRVKNEFIHHKLLHASMGIKIAANDLENAVAGSQLFVIKKEGDEQFYKQELQRDLDSVHKKITLSS
jgi:translation initiation factor 5B